MSLGYTKEIECPRCQKTNIETVPFLYKTLRSQDAGAKLFTESAIKTIASSLTPRQKERLLHRLTPPPEPKKTLPAGSIAAMAFLISWLITSSFFIERIGQKAYSIMSAVVVLFLVVPFYATLKLVIVDFRRDITNYRKIKEVWDKQYFCRDCQDVFIPKDDETKANVKRAKSAVR